MGLEIPEGREQKQPVPLPITGVGEPLRAINRLAAMQIPGALIPPGAIQMLVGIPLSVVRKLELNQALDLGLGAVAPVQALRAPKPARIRVGGLLPEELVLLGLGIPMGMEPGTVTVMAMAMDPETEKVMEVVHQAVAGLAAITPLTL
jgi:hypothetical protein